MSDNKPTPSTESLPSTAQALADVQAGEVISSETYEHRSQVTALINEIRGHGYSLARSRYAIGFALYQLQKIVAPPEFRRVLEEDLGGMSRQVAANYMRVVDYAETLPKLKNMAEDNWQKVLELCNGAEKQELEIILEDRHDSISMDAIDAASSREVKRLLKQERAKRQQIIDASVDAETQVLKGEKDALQVKLDAVTKEVQSLKGTTDSEKLDAVIAQVEQVTKANDALIEAAAQLDHLIAALPEGAEIPKKMGARIEAAYWHGVTLTTELFETWNAGPHGIGNPLD